MSIRPPRFLVVASCLLAACGKKAEAPACPVAGIEAMRARLAAAPPRQLDPDGLTPRILGVDGTDRDPAAVRVRFVDGDEVGVRVGDGQVRVAGTLGLTDELVKEIGTAQRVELEVFAALSPVPIVALLSKLDPAVEVRLVVDQLEAPPRAGVAPWAIELVDGLLAMRGDQRLPALSAALGRAVGPRCQSTLDDALRGTTAADDAIVRGALPEALTTCGCIGADLATAGWIYEVMAFPGYRPAWLRLRLDTGGMRLGDLRTMQEVAGAMETLTAAERVKGVWIVP